MHNNYSLVNNIDKGYLYILAKDLTLFPATVVTSMRGQLFLEYIAASLQPQMMTEMFITRNNIPKITVPSDTVL